MTPAATGTAANGPAEPDAAVEDFSLSLLRNGVRRDVLHQVDLSIPAGKITGLVGESGSGKSVLALALLGLLPTASHPRIDGTVRVGGVDMCRAPERQRRQVRRELLGAIFQDPMTSLNPTMRIGRQLAEVTAGTDESRGLLERVGVRDAALRLRVFPHELSGGLRQRVMAAMALAKRPQLIIADEPTTALDVTVQAQLLELLAELRDDFGCSVLMITHDLGVADQIADRLAVMHDGRLVEQGPAAAVVREPQHDYTRSLLQARLSMASPRDRRFDHPAEASTETSSKAVGRPPKGAPAAVAVRDLRCEFRPHRHSLVTALDGVDLEVGAGEALAIVGESGSGKSTLLRILAGLQPATGGTVTVSAGHGEGAQMVFQDAGSSLTPWLRVGEMLAERLRRNSVTRAEVRSRVAGALTTVGLDVDVAKARPSELSGGQRQRVALARAIMVPPAVLLCDEPTSALDANLARTVLALIRDIRAELGTTVLFVTHDLAVARLMGDRLAVMRDGRVVEIGETTALLAHPADPYTRTLLAAVPTIAGVDDTPERSGQADQAQPAGDVGVTGVASDGRV